jgi:hypothetical protein
MITRRVEISWILLICLLGVSLSGTRAMAVEEAKYKVVQSFEDIELRQYAPQIVAETFVEGPFDEVGNEGFRRLAAYIKGENRKRQSISMTAPVSQEARSEKIPMTAPVNQEQREGRWRITFLMPAKYTLETLPEPLDERVKLRREGGRLVAALRYSGTWSRKRYEERRARLEAFIVEQGLIPVGEPVFARYNPPFMPWFLRRNEVLIPVKQVRD